MRDRTKNDTSPTESDTGHGNSSHEADIGTSVGSAPKPQDKSEPLRSNHETRNDNNNIGTKSGVPNRRHSYDGLRFGIGSGYGNVNRHGTVCMALGEQSGLILCKEEESELFESEKIGFVPMYSKIRQELIFEKKGSRPQSTSSAMHHNSFFKRKRRKHKNKHKNKNKEKVKKNTMKNENDTLGASKTPNATNNNSGTASISNIDVNNVIDRNAYETEALLFEPPKHHIDINSTQTSNHSTQIIDNNNNNINENIDTTTTTTTNNNNNNNDNNQYSSHSLNVSNGYEMVKTNVDADTDDDDDNDKNDNNDKKTDGNHASSTKVSSSFLRQHSRASKIIAASHRDAALTRGNLDKKTPWYIINKHKIKSFLFEKIYILQWLPKYDRKNWLSNDIQAGIGVATMVIPQAIAYSNLVGLTPDVGLYTAMIGLLIYPLFGTSRHITVGAASISAIMTAASLSQFSELDNYHVYVNTMALTSGIMYIVMSFLGIGFIASFLALPVVIGFTAGCAWVIAASQLKYVFTIKEGGSSFLTNLALFRHIMKFSWVSIIIAALCILILQFVKRMPPYWDKLLAIDEALKKTDGTSSHLPREAVQARKSSDFSSTFSAVLIEPYSPKKRKYLSQLSKLFRQMPTALLLLVLFIFISYVANGFSSLVHHWDENESVFLVGRVNASLDFSNLGNFIDFSLFFDHGHTELLIVDALLLCIVCFTQHVAASVNYGMKHEYDVIAAQELLGIGFVNMVGSLFGIYPAAGVITHLPMSEQSNVKTLVFNWVTGVIIIFTFILLVLLPNLLYYLPKSVLAAIVLNACIGMFPWSEMKHVGKIDTRDTLLMIVTFLSTILIGIAEGVAVGFVFSIVLSIWRTSKPHCAILGRIPQTTIYRSIVAWPDAITTPGIIIFRFDGTLYFGNTSYFKQAIQVVCERYHRLNKCGFDNEHNNHNDSGFYFFVLDCHCINDIDSSGINAIEKIEKMLSNTFGATLMLTGVKYPVMKHIGRSGLLNIIGKHHFFHTVHEAKLYIWRRLKLLKSESFNMKDKHGYIRSCAESMVKNEGLNEKRSGNKETMSKTVNEDIEIDRAASLKMREAPLTNEEISKLRKGTRKVPMGDQLQRQFDVTQNNATSIRKQLNMAMSKQDGSQNGKNESRTEQGNNDIDDGYDNDAEDAIDDGKPTTCKQVSIEIGD